MTNGNSIKHTHFTNVNFQVLIWLYTVTSDVIIGGNWVKDVCDNSVLFLQLPVNL